MKTSTIGLILLVIATAVGLMLIGVNSAFDRDHSEPKNQTTQVGHSKPVVPFARIENLNNRECLCEMAGRSSNELRKAIAAATKGLKTEQSGTASLPLTFSSTCYPELGASACIGRAALVGDPTAFVCNSRQSDELERVWNKAMTKTDHVEVGDRAALQRLHIMRAELGRTLPASTCQLP